MAIKVALRKLHVPGALDRFVHQQLVLNGFALLPIALEHAAAIVDLPFHHRDPFDRLLVAQATVEELKIVSSDDVFERYGVKRVW